MNYPKHVYPRHLFQSNFHVSMRLEKNAIFSYKDYTKSKIHTRIETYLCRVIHTFGYVCFFPSSILCYKCNKYDTCEQIKTFKRTHTHLHPGIMDDTNIFNKTYDDLISTSKRFKPYQKYLIYAWIMTKAIVDSCV